MKFEIKHTTEYTYSEKVFFEPHFFRFKPKISTNLSVEEFNISIEPKPEGFSEQIDIENNHIILCWFNETYKSLKIEANTLVNVKEYNPFNFLIHPAEYLKLPFQYTQQTKQLLQASLQTDSIPESMKLFLNELLKASKYQTVPFLTELTKQIHQSFTLEIRETGNPHQPEFTFEIKKGSCRDLAWMQIHLMRNLGVASRFVSGYFFIDSENPEYELHAWLEAYIPGAGWIGFDPSHGLIVGMNHIPISSSSFPSNTMPVSGAVRGNAKQQMQHELEIKLLS